MIRAHLEQVTQLAEQTVLPLGLLVVEVKLGQQGRRQSLIVTIYRPQGRVGLLDCEQVSRQLEKLLDKCLPGLTKGSFSLEVQSPGVRRKLKSESEFRIFAGEMVEVRLRAPLESFGSDIKGSLVKVEDGKITIANPRNLPAGENIKKINRTASSKGDVRRKIEDRGALSHLEINKDEIIWIMLADEY